MTWPDGHIPEGWTDFFEKRGIAVQASANSSSGMALSEILHEGLTIALAAKKFGLVGGKGGREGGREGRPFRLHVLGATETEEARRLHLTMGELYKLLCPYYYQGKPSLPPSLPPFFVHPSHSSLSLLFRLPSHSDTSLFPSLPPSLPPS